MELSEIEQAKTPKSAAKAAPSETEAKTWQKMWYKGLHSVGIRRNKGHADKAQIFSLSNREWSQDELLALGDQCLKKLHDGEAESAVCEWSRAQLGK